MLALFMFMERNMTAIERIHNIQTGEVIERELTAEALAIRETRFLELQKAEQAAAQAAAAKAALLAKLGITEEEARLLLS